MQPDRFTRLVQYASQVAGASTASTAMVELQALSLISTWGNFWRIRVQEGPYKTTHPSTLTLVEAPTGTGKNAAYRFMQKHVFGFPFRQMLTFLFDEECSLYEQYVKDVNLKFPVEPGDPNEKKNTKERERAIKRYNARKRELSMITPDDGSYEGFAFDRAYLGELSFGAPTIRVDEYGDKLTLMKRAAYLQSFYNRMLELVDYPELTAKSIKDRGQATPGSSGMGITLYFTLAHPDSRQKEDIKRAVLKSIGRRGFLIRESNETVQLRSVQPPCVDEVETFSNEIAELTDWMHSNFSGRPRSERVIDLTPDARAWYELENERTSQQLQAYRDATAASEHKDLMCALQSDLDRKTLRVATLLALFNHGPEAFHVTVADLKQAQGIVQRSFESAKRFFDESAYSNTNQVLSFLQQRGAAGASALDLMDLPTFRGLPKRSFQEPVYDLMMSEVAPEARTMGLVVEHFKVRKRDFYLCRTATADDAFLDAAPAAPTPAAAKPVTEWPFSYRPGLDPSKSEGFQVCTDRSRLQSVIQGEYLYSACTFAGGKRKQDNFERASLVILDFDDGPTLAEIREQFKDYSYLVATTKSHQKEKHGVIHDRFRLVLLGNYEFTDRNEFRLFMGAMTDRFGSDPACKDAARTYFGTPGCSVETNSGRPFPVREMLQRLQAEEQLRRAKAQQLSSSPARSGGSSEHTMPNFTLHDARGRAHDAATFIGSLPQDDQNTTPIRCPFPGHDDSNPSAFVSHRSNGGLQVTCSGCATTKFIST